MMKLVTWNVNSVRKRAEVLESWIGIHAPDVLCLQETKVVDEDFPKELFANCGMNVVFSGQKAYNGVAIASPRAIDDVQCGLPGMNEEGQKRLIAATINGIRVICAYVPNGGGAAPKYEYKLEWMQCYAQYLQQQRDAYGAVAAGGDYNVAPSDDDVYDIDEYGRDQVGVRPEERKAWQDLLAAGYDDAHALMGSKPADFTWWDYRGGGYRRNHGLRIDHFLLAGLNCASLEADRAPRNQDTPSDHIPVICRVDKVQ